MRAEIAQILLELGYDPKALSMRETPERYEKLLRELTELDGKVPPELKTFPVNDTGEVVIVKNIKTASLCPHHVQPYLLTGHFGYAPNSQVVGISKPARLLEWCAHRFILQEEIGPLLIKHFDTIVTPYGSIIVLEGKHLCATIRGAKQQESTTLTVASSGCFRDDKAKRDDFWRLVTEV